MWVRAHSTERDLHCILKYNANQLAVRCCVFVCLHLVVRDPRAHLSWRHRHGHCCCTAWLDGVICCVSSCWLSVVLCSSFLSRLPVSLVLSNCFTFPFLFFLIHILFLSLVLQIVRCAGLHICCFRPRSHCD